MEMSNRPRWSHQEESLIIKFYHNHPMLWDPKNDDYFRRDIRDKHLSQLRHLLIKKIGRDIATSDIKTKFKILRTQFKREERRVAFSKKSVSGTEGVFTPKWMHYKHLAFLRDSIKAEEQLNTADNPSTARSAIAANVENKSTGSALAIEPEIVTDQLLVAEKNSPRELQSPEENYSGGEMEWLLSSLASTTTSEPRQVTSTYKRPNLNSEHDTDTDGTAESSCNVESRTTKYLKRKLPRSPSKELQTSRMQMYRKIVDFIQGSLSKDAASESCEDAFGTYVARTMDKLSESKREDCRVEIVSILGKYIKTRSD